MKKNKIFISYSHKDDKWLEILNTHIKVLKLKGINIDVWDDTKIIAGQKWKEEIEKSLNESFIAILLISTDYLASDFIINNELSNLLFNAENKGTKIISLILRPCSFLDNTELSQFQAVNKPDKPLIKYKSAGRDEILLKLMKIIEYYINDIQYNKNETIKEEYPKNKHIEIINKNNKVDYSKIKLLIDFNKPIRLFGCYEIFDLRRILTFTYESYIEEEIYYDVSSRFWIDFCSLFNVLNDRNPKQFSILKSIIYYKKESHGLKIDINLLIDELFILIINNNNISIFKDKLVERIKLVNKFILENKVDIRNKPISGVYKNMMNFIKINEK